MPEFSNAQLTAACAALMSAATNNCISLHSADPGATGANEIVGGTYIRVATTWATPPVNGVVAGSQVTINVPASTTVAYFGVWSATTAGTYCEGHALPTSETYSGAGTYLLTPSLSATG